MTRQSSEDASSFCEGVLSSLRGDLRVSVSYFIDGHPARPESTFDYRIIVVAPGIPGLGIPLYSISDAKELSFLESLFLREGIRHIDPSYPFVLGARFGPRVNRGPKGKILNPLEILSSRDDELMEHLVQDLGLVSPQYTLFDLMPPRSVDPLSDGIPVPFVVPPFLIPGFLQDFMERLHGKETLTDMWFDFLSNLLYWVIRDVGLAKLLAIPELDPKQKGQDLPLTKEDASRIRLVHNIVHPRYNVRPTLDPASIGVHWAKIPARLFVYGPILDLVNALQGKQIVKVCWNCGRLYRPYRYQKEGQRYCCSTCRKRAQSKRLYQDKKRERGNPNPRKRLKNTP